MAAGWAWLSLTILLPALASEQCGTGDPSCPCVFSYAGFNVSNLDADGHLIVELSGEQHDYGPAYGLGVCAATAASYTFPGTLPSWRARRMN